MLLSLEWNSHWFLSAKNFGMTPPERHLALTRGDVQGSVCAKPGIFEWF
jgi:hypothetical protein